MGSQAYLKAGKYSNPLLWHLAFPTSLQTMSLYEIINEQVKKKTNDTYITTIKFELELAKNSILRPMHEIKKPTPSQGPTRLNELVSPKLYILIIRRALSNPPIGMP